MSYILFHIRTGERIKEYSTEKDARTGMRTNNRNAGWSTRISRSWTDGYECEWCSNGQDYAYAPYAITERQRWESKFNPARIELSINVAFA